LISATKNNCHPKAAAMFRVPASVGVTVPFMLPVGIAPVQSFPAISGTEAFFQSQFHWINSFRMLPGKRER
jgi:hypothetical protein